MIVPILTLYDFFLFNKMIKSAVLCILTLLYTCTSYYISIECPETCICNREVTDCKNNNFSELPNGLDPNVSALDFAYNNFQTFPEDLNLYSNLRYLNLSYNKLQNLGNKAFVNLKKLEILDLTFNLFRDWANIGSNIFLPAKSLSLLDLSHNELKSFPNDKSPIQINSLNILRLNNCSINYVNNKIVSKLPNIHELHLSGNPISYIEAPFLSKSLKFLDLSGCNLKFISPSAFSQLTSLETLYMNHNRNLKKINCDSSSLLYLDLSDCNLEIVPGGYLPNVNSVMLHGNHLRIIPNYSFANYTNLEMLDISDNALSNIEEYAFSGLTKLQTIDLSSNTLSNINQNLFESNENLRALYLSRNYISIFPFLISDSLEILDLSHCEIYDAEFNYSLLYLPSIKILNLSRNNIRSLPDKWQSEELIKLDVSMNRITNVNNKTFSYMPSLRNVNLAGNRLTTADPESFPQVITLDISDNPWRCECPTLKPLYSWLLKTGKTLDGLYCQSPAAVEGMSWKSACSKEWDPKEARSDSVWWYTTGLIVTVFVILFFILGMRRMYLLKKERVRDAEMARRQEERERLRRMQRAQAEARDEGNRNAPDPRELQTPPSYNEALLLPKLDASHPSLSGSLHSIASKGSLTDVSKRSRTRRKRRRRKSDSSEGQRASRVVVDSDTTDAELPQPRTTLESDF